MSKQDSDSPVNAQDGSLKNVRHIDDIVGSILARGEGSARLKNLPGKGFSTLELGMPRLIRHAKAIGMHGVGLDAVERKALEAYAKGAELTESPIERSMLAALVTGDWAGCHTVPPIVHDSRKDASELLPPGEVVIVPQMAFIKYRLDFGIIVERGGSRTTFAVECDGQAFHSNAELDRRRDQYLQSWGVLTFRCRGSALHEDAIAEADRIISAICQWRGI